MKAVTIITDVHLRKANTLTEPTLLKEQTELMNKVLGIVASTTKKVDEHYVVFAGDIVHRTLNDMVQAAAILWINDIFDMCNGVYSVVGNHELSFMKKGNIFWNLVYGSRIQVPVKFERLRPLIHVEDGFKVDDCYIKLWHYGQDWLPITDESVKDLIVVGHNAVKFPGLRETYDNNGVDIKDLYLKYYDLAKCVKNPEILRWVFLGHMHTLVGRFKFDEVINGSHYNFMLENMGSLSRTDSSQFDIQNTRNIPTVYIDGQIVNVENHLIELSDKSVLCQEEIEERKEVYEKGKFIKQLKKTEFSETDIVKEVENMYAYDLEKLQMFRQALTSEGDKQISDAMSYLYNVSIYG